MNHKALIRDTERLAEASADLLRYANKSRLSENVSFNAREKGDLETAEKYHEDAEYWRGQAKEIRTHMESLLSLIEQDLMTAHEIWEYHGYGKGPIG